MKGRYGVGGRGYKKGSYNMHGLIGIKKYILIYRWAFEDVWIAVGYYINK